MGFPNDGAERVVARLRARRASGVVGVNIGKNAVTPLDRAIDDYIFSLRKVFTVTQLKLPSTCRRQTTAGLKIASRRRSSRAAAVGIFEESTRVGEPALAARPTPREAVTGPDRGRAAKVPRRPPPVPVAGIYRDQHHHHARKHLRTCGLWRAETGGLSGRPLFAKSCAAIRTLRDTVGPTLPIIGVGGVASGADARQLRQAGADLIQLYTGMILSGAAARGEDVAALR